jgi:hypothetical protein
MDQNFSVLEVFKLDCVGCKGHLDASIFKCLSSLFDFVRNKDMA